MVLTKKYTLGWCKIQVAMSTWGTVCLVDRTWDSQTRRRWMDTITNHRKDKKHRRPIGLGTSYIHSSASSLSATTSHRPPCCCGGWCSREVCCRKPKPARVPTRLWLIEVEEKGERWSWNPSFFIKQKSYVLGFCEEACWWVQAFIHIFVYIYTIMLYTYSLPCFDIVSYYHLYVR